MGLAVVAEGVENEAQLAILDVLTSGMAVRAAEVKTSNLLIRLAPNDRVMAARYAEEALGGGGGEKSRRESRTMHSI